VLGRDTDELETLLDAAGDTAPDAPVARAALDCALHDLVAQAAGAPLAAWLATASGGAARTRVAASALVTSPVPAEAAVEAVRLRDAGFRCLKLKLGAAGALERDLARIAAVRAAIGHDCALRLDANGAWSAAEAARALAALGGLGVELVEQPVASSEVEVLAALRANSPVRIAADESAAVARDLARVLALRAADVVVLKPAALGGLRAAWRLAARARAIGCELFVTTLLDGAVSRAAALALAAALPGPLRACGLATGALLAADLAPPEPIRDGALDVPARPGLGVALDAAALARVADGRGRVALERAARAHA
jgi:L-alanine-DL-glutamate epimerase-like enolase superfamily enzyme